MAELPTTEEMERVILDIFKEFNVRSGEILLLQNFLSAIANTKYRTEDFERGMDSLIEKGHVTKKDNRFFLTDSGFQEM